MNKKILFLLAIPILFLFSSCGYNKMVSLDELVKTKWANVQNAYQRRADLIPNLVNTVKGYAAHEEETLMGVIESRSKATGINLKADELTPEKIQQFQAAQNQLSGALARLLVVVEKYPDLKANQNFLELQAQLEGTENRISVERKYFNEAVQEYNTYIRKFPSNLIASIFKFQAKGYFEADTNAQKVPKVNF